MRNLFKALLFILFLLLPKEIFATHIRAADITAERIGLTQYKIRLSVYTDYNNVKDNLNSQNPIDVETLTIGFGNQSNPLDEVDVKRKSVKQIVSGETFENIYELVYNFPAVNNGYVIYFVGKNRNDNVVNINNSANSFIYVETFVFIDAFSPVNTSPKFTVPPIDIAAVNKVYTHNPGAYDADGDSLAFELIDPRDSYNKTVDGYRYPDHPSFGSPSTFKIDAKTGQITWDTPKIAGEYNIAFKVSEYRDGIRIGYVIRDMQINVFNTNNNPPIIDMPADTCISAGVLYQDRFMANDPDFNSLAVELYGSYIEQGGTYKVLNVRTDIKAVDLTWIPPCSAVGQQTIQGIVRAVDVHPVSLSTIKTWNIQVYGQKPVLISAIPSNNEISLSWNKYPCVNSKAKILIYRAECDTSKVKRSVCTAAIPEEWGFVKVGEVDINATGFIDGVSNKLSSGIQYYYMIYVDFGVPSFGVSYASNILGASLNSESPLINEISFSKKDLDTKILINAFQFETLDTIKYKSPYTFSITNDSKIIYSTVSIKAEVFSVLLDTSFLNYLKPFELEMRDNQNQLVGSQSLALSEKLSAIGTDEALNISWTNDNLWFYSDTLYQKIYSFKAGGDTVLVDSVLGGKTSYQITNLMNGDSVCAYVETAYSYCLEGLDSVFHSFTKTSCALIKDDVPPCPPVLSIELIDCDAKGFGNRLSWSYNGSPICSKDVASFELFKKNEFKTGSFYSKSNYTLNHLSDIDLEGEELNCYYILAKDSSGNVSKPSNTVCQDFCSDVILPNIFTPNNDGKNDSFVSKTNFSGFSDVLFVVYNRWGKEVYREAEFTHLSWDGKSTNGEYVSDGVYYFYVSGNRLTGTLDKLEYKGWLTIIK